jgi:hypothetical protein
VTSLNSWLLLVIFLGCAAAIWIAGIKLSDTTDVLSERLHLGSALGLVFRPQWQWLRMGPDSLAVLILYAIGITGLAFIAS